MWLCRALHWLCDCFALPWAASGSLAVNGFFADEDGQVEDDDCATLTHRQLKRCVDDLAAAFEARRTFGVAKAFVLFSLCALSGRRASDVLRLRWRDVRLRGEDVSLSVRVGSWKTGGAAVWLDLQPGPLAHGRLQRALEKLRTKRGRGDQLDEEDRGVFLLDFSQKAVRSQREVIASVLRSHRAAWGGSNVTLRTPRKTVCTVLRQRGHSLEQIASLVGHSDLRSLLFYIENSRGARRASARSVGWM